MKKSLILFFAILFCTSFILAATPGSCDYVLNESITFDSDLNCSVSSFYALSINASDIILDCAGYTLRTNVSYSSGIGFELNSPTSSNITIKNCVFENFTSAVYMKVDDTENITLENITIIGNEKDSYSTFDFENVTNLTLRDINVLSVDRPDYILDLRTVNGSLIDGLIVNEMYGGGFFLYDSKNISIINSNIMNAKQDGAVGIEMYYLDGVISDNLTFYNITGNAIYMRNVTNAHLHDIVIDEISEIIDGIFIRQGLNNITLENIVFSNMNLTDYLYYQIWITDTAPTDQLVLKNITFIPHLQQIYIGTREGYPSNNINLTSQATNTSIVIRAGSGEYFVTNGIRFNTTEFFFADACLAYGNDFMSVNSSCSSLNRTAEILFAEYIGGGNNRYNYTIYINESGFPETNTSILNTTVYEDNLALNYDYNYDGINDSVRIVVDHFSGYAIEARDRDNDSVADFEDNCINDSNSNQADSDGDGIGDVCDTTSSSTSSSSIRQYNMTTNLTEYEIYIVESLREEDKLIYEFKSSTHTITLDKIDYSSKQVDVTIESTPKEFTLSLGQTLNVDLDEDGIDDILVTLEKILSSSALIIVRTIEPTLVPVSPPNKTIDKEVESEEIKEEPLGTFCFGCWIFWIILTIIVVLIIVWISLNKRKKKQLKNLFLKI